MTPASGKPCGDGFGEGGDIRRDAHLLHGEQGTGAARAALDLIGDEHNAVLVAQGAQALHKGRGGGIEPAFTLHRLNNDGGDIFRRGIVFEDAMDAGDRLVITDAVQRARVEGAIDMARH